MEKHITKDRPESYPKPGKADRQFDNQPEFIDQQPNDFRDKSVSSISPSNAERQNNEPQKDLETGEK